MFDNIYSSISLEIDTGIGQFLKDFSSSAIKMNLTHISNYKQHNVLGHGTYGVVHKASRGNEAPNFAIKWLKIDDEKEGFPVTALREIKILKSLKHDNLVSLRDICYEIDSRLKTKFFLVFELCQCDLLKVISEPRLTIPLIDKKTIMYQILCGTAFMHSKKYMHRDLKPANILISGNGIVKIADFGLSRQCKPTNEAKYTNNVVTMWYRAPEVVLFQTTYTSAVDVWSNGCIFAELWRREPLFQANDETALLAAINKVLGGINEEVWPGALEKANLKGSNKPNVLRQVLKLETISAVDLIAKMIMYDSAKRLSAADAMQSKFFQESPKMSKYVSCINNFNQKYR